MKKVFNRNYSSLYFLKAIPYLFYAALGVVLKIYPVILLSNVEEIERMNDYVGALYTICILFAFPIPILMTRKFYARKGKEKLEKFNNIKSIKNKNSNLKDLVDIITLDHTYISAERAILNMKIFEELKPYLKEKHIVALSDISDTYHIQFNKIKNRIKSKSLVDYSYVLKIKMKNLNYSYSKSKVIESELKTVVEFLS